MKVTNKIKTRSTPFVKYVWLLVFAWLMFVLGSVIWNIIQIRNATNEMARIQARGAFQRDVAYRLWNANHNGVYVPITAETEPNPDLTHLPHRDITTSSGEQLTLMNPAYMTRQVHELAKEKFGIRSHITSLKPIRSGNRADSWETEALKAFEQGKSEISSLEKIDGAEYMRLMRPLKTEQACLKCHAAQGYKNGEIRGGISISIPMEPLTNIARTQIFKLIGGHFVLWLAGLFGLLVGLKRIKRSEQARNLADEELKNVSSIYQRTIENAQGVPYRLSYPDRKYEYIGSGCEELLGIPANKMTADVWKQMAKKYIILDKDVPQDIEKYANGFLKREYKRYRVDVELHTPAGEIKWISDCSLPLVDEKTGEVIASLGILQDITERKRTENLLEKLLREKETLLKEVKHALEECE